MLRRHSIVLLIALALGVSSCGDDDSGGNRVAQFDVIASEPRFVVPSAGLPPQVEPLPSNANVDISFHDGRLFMAWRSAPRHFASAETKMYVVSSSDTGVTWEFEREIALGTDVREPRLLSLNGRLQLLFFEAGHDPLAFEPKRILRTFRNGLGDWSDLEVLVDEPEVPWDLKVRQGVAFLTSYQGEHYGTGESDVRVLFKSSSDGIVFTPVDGRPYVYRGGVSETAFEFDSDGALWIVTRNEDGDDTGFGSHVCVAPADSLADWDCPARSDPERYDSPEMFRHEDDLYLVARRDIGGPFDEGLEELTFEERKFQYLTDYSLRPKRTALYRIDRQQRSVVHLFDLPGAGDTAFASVQQTGPHTFLMANYTSPLDDPDISWLSGQNSERGTQIYLLTLSFVPTGTGPTTTPTPPPTETPTPTEGPPFVPEAPVLSPVFAGPGTSLSIEWPEEAGDGSRLDLGDGTIVGPETIEHGYANSDAVFDIEAMMRFPGVTSTFNGGVARTGRLYVTPLRRFQLTQPNDPFVQGVIRGVIPAFYFAFDGERLAVATDPTARGSFSFDAVKVAAASMDGESGLATAPIELDVELAGTGATASGVVVGLVAVVFRAAVIDGVLQSPVEISSEIVIADLVTALNRLGGLDEAAALQFISGVFGFDPATPPATAGFSGLLPIETRGP
jgi:hypothetical protein